MRWRRLVLLMVSFVVAAAATTGAAISVNVATGGEAAQLPWLERHPWWWSAGATLVLAGAAALGFRAQRRYDAALVALLPAVQRPESWVVDRPAEVSEVVNALRPGGTTAVFGAGGFGKTTVARLVRTDRRVLRRFGGRVYWVTLGRDVRRGALVEKINDLVRQIDPARAQPFTDRRQAAEHLAAVLAGGPRRLVILDDVWFDDQLAAFPVVGRGSRLITTRRLSVVAGHGVPVKVAQMSAGQARRVLLDGLRQPPSDAVVSGLLAETGRWPLLLRLINKIIVDQARSRTDVDAVASDLLEHLRQFGPARTGAIYDPSPGPLDVADPDQRNLAVTATIEAGTGLLSNEDHARFTELAVFAEDSAVPVALIAGLWRSTGAMAEAATRALCVRLADLALLELSPSAAGGTVSLHDVIRDLLARRLGPAATTRLHRVLLGTLEAGLPRVPADRARVTAWWELPPQDGYVREHLIEHLIAAGRGRTADALAVDLRWVQSRLEDSGPLGVFADLSRIDTPAAERLRRLVARNAHLIAPTEPAYSCVDILLDRVTDDPDWGPPARALAGRRTLPVLAGTWPPPDRPDPALRRALTSHGLLHGLAIAPDGSWLVSSNGHVQIWDPATGRPGTRLAGDAGRVEAVAVAPDGTWLATGDRDGSVGIWDVATGALRATFTSHAARVETVAIAPDGTWIASVHSFGSVWIWDVATGGPRTSLTVDAGRFRTTAIAPDGTWLAAANAEGAVGIWDVATGRLRVSTTDHTGPVQALAIAPDGTWFATGGSDGAVEMWDVAANRLRVSFSGHSDAVTALAIAADGTWLATGGSNGSLRMWDATTGRRRAALSGHPGSVVALVIAPDGSWLASGGSDGSLRIWDGAGARQAVERRTHAGSMAAVAVAPDGTWLATGGTSVRVWAAGTGRQRTHFGGAAGPVTAVAIAPDGTWLATGGNAARIWDVATGRERATLMGDVYRVEPVFSPEERRWLAGWLAAGAVREVVPLHYQETVGKHTRLTRPTGPVRAVAIAPDGTWLATGGGDGAVGVWHVAELRQRARFFGHTGPVSAVAFAPDGAWLATGGEDRSVRIWDLGRKRQRARLTGHTYPVKALAVAPDGTWLASASWGSVRIWDPGTGRQLARFAGAAGAVVAVAIAPDGARLATGCTNGSVQIWDVRTGRPAAMTRVDGEVRGCGWSPDGQLLFVGTDNGLHRFEYRNAATSSPVG